MSDIDRSWNFPLNNYSQIFGIGDSGVETFKGNPLKSLAREICQNSLDASLQNGEPVRIDFATFTLTPDEVPDLAGLTDAFSRSLDFWSRQKSDTAKKFFRKALATTQKSEILCLRVSDHNTIGLTGSTEEYNSHWSNLTKSTGTSDKGGATGGSFGIGKYAPYACSDFRTVFYSTADREGMCAYQGIARLTSFKKKNGRVTQGIGFFGDKNNAPVPEQISLDASYARKADDFGTDIFVLGFIAGKDWQEKMVASVLDGFLYAVYRGELVVDVAGIKISKETLPDLIMSYKEYFKEYADEYYAALTAADEDIFAKTFTEEIADDARYAGKLTLRLLLKNDFHRKVAMVRQTGMKIKDKDRISGTIPFTGVLYIEGEALNDYLRNLENPQHLDWETNRADNKTKARKLLTRFNQFIKKSLDVLWKEEGEKLLAPPPAKRSSPIPQISEEESSEIPTDTLSATVRIFCRDKAAGKYAVMVTPKDDANEGKLELYMAAETGFYPAVIKEASCDDCPELKLAANRIEGFSFQKDVPVKVHVTLDYYDYCSMEVKVYGTKV